MRHQENTQIIESFKKCHDIDIPKLIRELKSNPDAIHFQNQMIVKNFGYGSASQYFDETSCHKVIKDIKSPTLFMHAQDDPLMNSTCVDFEAISQNPNTILGMTKMGGHTSYHESLFDTSKQWFIPVALDFLQKL